MPKPPSDLQLAQQQVSTAYDPVLQQIRDAYTQMVNNTGTVYNAGAKQLADLYGQYGPATQAAYDRAGQGLAGVQALLAATQQGQGAAGAADLAHQLQGIDTATMGRVNADFGQALQGEALANATKGANNIAMLLSQGAHAGQYGAALPGIGGQIGFQGLEQAIGNLNQNQQQELAKLAAEEPGAVQTALGQLQTNRNQQAQLAFENKLKTQNANNSTSRANAPKIVHTADGSVIAVNSTTGATIAQISGPKPPGTPKQQKPTTFKGTDGRTYVYNPKAGTATPIAGQSGPKPLKPPPGPSTTEQRWDAAALGGARKAHTGFTDSKNVYHPPISWQQYLNEGLSEKIPIAHLIKQGRRIYSQAEIHQGLIPKGAPH
jgi:hypothetical protein